MNKNNFKLRFLFNRMKKEVIVLFIGIFMGIFLNLQSVSSSLDYNLNFSTYLGSSATHKWEFPRDVAVDSNGNIYVTGAIAGTPGDVDFSLFNAYDESYNGDGSDGSIDIFVAKYNPSGVLQWFTFLGGSEHDRAYAIELDDFGNIYVAGRCGRNCPTTAGTFQRNDCALFSSSICAGQVAGEAGCTSTSGDGWNGINDGGVYGCQNGYIAKLSNDGSTLIWASYVGSVVMIRDFAVDSAGRVYVALPCPLSSRTNARNPSSWYIGNYKETCPGGRDFGVGRISADGTTMEWATYLGGSGIDSICGSIRVDSSNNVYALYHTQSTSGIASPGAYDTSHNGANDFVVEKLNPSQSGSAQRIWSTYVGGNGDEYVNTHNLALDSSNNVYVSAWTSSTNWDTHAGAYDETWNGGRSDIAITKISADGTQRLASTYLGGSGNDNPDGLYVDPTDTYIFLGGSTHSSNWSYSANAYDISLGGNSDAIFAVLTTDLETLEHITYFGGDSDTSSVADTNDAGHSIVIDPSLNVYLVGTAGENGFPTFNAEDSTYNGGETDIFISKFSIDMSSQTCSSGQKRCNGNYSQTCGDYDSDSCLEWPFSTSGAGNVYCSYGCEAGQCLGKIQLPSGPNVIEVTGDDRAKAVVTLGSVVTGGDQMALVMNFPAYEAVVDIYAAVQLPDGSLYVVASDGSLTMDLVPYRPGVTDAQNATILDSFDVCTPFGSSVLTGTWWVYSVVAPTNGGDFSAINFTSGDYDLRFYSFDVTCPYLIDH